MFDRRIIFIFFLLIALIAAVSSVGAADSSDIINATPDEAEIGSPAVDVEDDGDILQLESEDEVLEASNAETFTELQNKINNAKKGSTITLTKDYKYNKDFGSKSGIKITKTLTIDGKGHSINGLEESALICINKANNVVFKDIIFKNANYYLNGRDGGIGSVGVFYSDNVNFINCRFVNDWADYGGAVFLGYSNNCSFVKCSFIDDLSYLESGVVHLAYSSSSFDSCTFSKNVVPAIYSDYGNSSLSSSVFSGNSHAAYLIYSNFSFDSCKFNNNEAENGAAIYLDHCSSFFDSCNFDGNNAEFNGGAIYALQSVINCLNTNFKNNIVPFSDDWETWSEYGGGAMYLIQSALNCVNTSFEDNYVDGAGGDIYSCYSMVSLDDSSFYGSYAYGFGGSLSFNNDYVQIDNCTFGDCKSENNGGGAIYCLNSIVNSVSSQFKDCSAYHGGAICSLNTELTIRNNVFYNIEALVRGGSIYSLYGSIAVEESNFTFSSAELGGVMYIRSPHRISSITNNRFLYSSADVCQRIYVDEYYDEIPESGNVYEDVYFVLCDFNFGLSYDDDYYNYSNILTYVFSNADGYQNDLSFYQDLRDMFISDWDRADGPFRNDFNIFDESHPTNSTIFFNYDDYNGSSVIYDTGHWCDEFNLSEMEVHVYKVDGGFDLNYFKIIPGHDSSDGNLSYIHYYGTDYSENGLTLCPIGDGEKNVTLLEKHGNQCIWVCSADSDEFHNYKINGTFYFNCNERNLYYNRGNAYHYKTSFCPVPLLNPAYASDEILEDYYFEEEYLTSIKDQGIGGNCWAFAGIATLEACLKKITGVEYDFSENNAKNLMAASSIYGLNIDANAGGYDSMFMGYLASWLGPINEGFDEYNPASSLSTEEEPLFHIQDISFLSPRKNSLDNDEFKYAIKNYGAVSVIFDCVDNWTDNGYSGFHAVSLVGWDDGYVGWDSFGNYAKGAWIFKNSWGELWCSEWLDIPDGYGYLSYNQKLSGEISPYMHAYTFIFNDSDVGYQEIYQYDFAGFTDFLCEEGDIYYKNKFTAKDSEYLYAFSTYFEKPAYFTFSVRINGKDITKTDDNATIERSLHYSPAGYHTISLGYNLTLNKGDEFEIIIKLVNEDINYIPVCQADELYKLTYPSNVSFVSHNGEDWTDLYDLQSDSMFAYGGNMSNTCQVACIKAFTSTWRGGSAYNRSEEFTFNGIYEVFQINCSICGIGMDKTLVIEIPDWDFGNVFFENFAEVNINNGEKVYYVKFINSCFNMTLDDLDYGYYICSVKLKSNWFSSNSQVLDFIIGDERFSGKFSELQEIIDNAGDGDVITLDKDYYSDLNFNESHILINKSLTIDGDDYLLSGLSKSGIFKISSGCNVTFKNIHFVNGICSAILSNGTINIFNCMFSSDHAGLGGAIHSEGECHIEDTWFYFNSGGTIFSNGILSITDSVFKSGQHAEPIYLENNGELYLKNNRMDIKSAAVVHYNGNGIPYSAPLRLIFTNGSVIKGEFANLCKIVDENGNTFRIGDVNATLAGQSGSVNINVEYDSALGGYAFNTNSLDYGVYNVTGSVSDCYASNCTVFDGILRIVKKSVLSASSLTVIYGKNNKLKVTLKDEDGNALANTYIDINLNGKTVKIKTDSNGGAVLDVGLAPKTYATSIRFTGDENYYSAVKNIKVTVKKAASKILASKRTFKLKPKTKKYTIALRNNLGKAIKYSKVTIKVNGKTYTAKTNSKGKASFKITKLNRKGTFKATVKYAGNKYYKSVTKKVTIKVK